MDSTTYHVTKVVVIGSVVLALVIGLIVGLDPAVGVPLLTAVFGYVTGNAKVTNNQNIIEYKNE